MEDEEKQGLFWPSMVDLMTSLFFIMLVLFVVIFLAQRRSIQELQLKQKALEEVKNVQKALNELDPKYFEYDQKNKRFRMLVDIEFQAWQFSFDPISPTRKAETLMAGKRLFSFFDQLHKNSPKLKYLFIVEGQAARYGSGNLNFNSAYRLSYNRSLALLNFWKENDLDFNSFGESCELLIVGSGYFGKSRYPRVNVLEDDIRNRRFTIQITPIIGDLESLK